MGPKLSRFGGSPHARLPNASRTLCLGAVAQELPLHRIHLGDVCRDIVVTAAFAGDQTEAAAREVLGRGCTAEMNHRGELLLLLQAGGHVWSAGKNRRDVAVINECSQFRTEFAVDSPLEDPRAVGERPRFYGSLGAARNRWFADSPLEGTGFELPVRGCDESGFGHRPEAHRETRPTA